MKSIELQKFIAFVSNGEQDSVSKLPVAESIIASIILILGLILTFVLKFLVKDYESLDVNFYIVYLFRLCNKLIVWKEYNVKRGLIWVNTMEVKL